MRIAEKVMRWALTFTYAQRINGVTMKATDIKTLRESRGWSQQKLAEELGVDQATVSRIERGTAQPSGPVSRLLERLLSEPTTGAAA